MSLLTEKSFRIAVLFLLLLVLANALAAGLHTMSDPDMGWHLATGRYVVQHHSIPSTDVLSYTSAGAPWVYPPFAGVLLYLIYGVGGYAGLSWFCALVCVAVAAYLVRGRDLASIVLAMCAVVPISYRVAARADLFSTVFFAIFLGVLWAFQRGAGKRLWLLPVLMLIWVNVHPGFVVGLAVIGAYLLLEVCDLPFAERRDDALKRLRQAWPWLTGTAAVTLLNPWGYKVYSASLAMAGLGQSQTGPAASAMVSEYLAVPLSSHMLAKLADIRYPDSGFLWLMVIAVFVIGLAIWRKQLGVVIIQASALYFAVQHVRYVGLFCITTTILGATLLGETFSIDPGDASSEELPAKRPPVVRVPVALGLLFVCAVCAITVVRIADFISNRDHVVFSYDSRFGAGESTWFPERAASFIKRERLPGNIYEEYALGGFAALRLGPDYPDFIDGRAVSPAVLTEEGKLHMQSPDSPIWQQAADRWGVNVLLIPEAAPRAADRQDAMTFCQSTNWRPVYMDEVSLVLVRNVPANRPWIDRLQIDCSTHQFLPPQTSSRKDLYDYFSNVGGMYFALQRDHESETALLRAAGLYPQDPNVRVALAQLYQRHQMFDRAEAEYRASLALDETDQPWFELGSLYMQQNRLPEAEQAYSRAAQISSSPCLAYVGLAQVELSLRHAEPALRALDGAEKSSPYRNAEAIAPEFYGEIADDRAEAHRMLAQLPQAIRFEQEAVRLNPTVASLWNKLADLYASAGEPDLSNQARERARELGGGAGR